MGLGVWGKNSGWYITGTMSMGAGGSIPFLELGGQMDGMNITIKNRRTGQQAMYQATGLGLSIGAGLSPVNFSASGPQHETLNNAIYTWDETELTPRDLEGSLWVWGANAEFFSSVNTGQVWYFRGPGWNLNPWGSSAAAWVAGEGSTTEIAAGSFNGTRYKLELIKTVD